MKSSRPRLRELDFLRGIAIILVLFRHGNLSNFTTNIGWIGVDLFFVLSGYLVSGLLFREYIKLGSIRPKRFLIRRGFKIYPIYYLFYLPYLIPLIPELSTGVNLRGFVSDMFFVQNYVWGWGWAYAASWSLAVEEHFYFGFSLFLWFALRKGLIRLKPEHPEKKFGHVEIIIVSIMAICLCLRIVTNYLWIRQTAPSFSMSDLPMGPLARGISMTHLRIDSLLAGVLISYLYNFRIDQLRKILRVNKAMLVILSLLLLSFTFVLNPITSFFVKTIGFTLVFIAFGIILILFILDKNINNKLDKIFSKPIVNLVSKIGFCSYSIYVIHLFMSNIVAKFGWQNHTLSFLVFAALSICSGMIMTYYIEQYFLKIRDKYYPSRTV